MGPPDDGDPISPEAESETQDRTLCLLTYRTCNVHGNVSWAERKEKTTQLTLEHQGFEFHKSTYTQILFHQHTEETCR